MIYFDKDQVVPFDKHIYYNIQRKKHLQVDIFLF